VRRLTAGLLAIWVATGLITILLSLAYWFMAVPVLKKVRDEAGVVRLPVATWAMPDLAPADRARVDALNALYLTTQLALVVAVVTGLLSASALGTLLLVDASRRATLRQIQASLAAIAGQLAEVQKGRGTMPPTAGGDR
jgi:hypothetical protein